MPSEQQEERESETKGQEVGTKTIPGYDRMKFPMEIGNIEIKTVREAATRAQEIKKKTAKIFTCKQCGKTAKSGAGLAKHVTKHKLDKWKKEHGRA